MLRVEVIGARDLMNVDTDGSLSDPFVIVRAGAQQQSTLVVQNNLSPIWDETMMFAPAGMLDVVVKDDSGKALGEVHVPLDGIPAGTRKEMDLALQGVRSGRVQLAITPGAQAAEEAEVVAKDDDEEIKCSKAPAEGEEEEEMQFAVKDEDDKGFGASKPWTGAINAPSRYIGQRFPLTPPEARLSMAHVFGYRGVDCRHNVFALPDGTVAYHVAGIAIVADPQTRQQRFYRDHTDDILCLAADAAGARVATAQIGKAPFICIWDPRTMETLAKLERGHTHGINAVAFSPDGTKLASVGLDDDHMVVVWDLATGRKLGALTGGKNKVLDLQWAANSEEFVAVGVKAITFFSCAGGHLTSGKGLFGGKPIDTLTCAQYLPAATGTLVTGTASGALYLWRGRQLSAIRPAHQGRCDAVCALPDGGVMTGGLDGKLMVWGGAALKKVCEVPLATPVRALSLRGRRLCVGTSTNAVLELAFNPTNNQVESAAGQPAATATVVRAAAPAPRPGGLPAARAPAAAPPTTVIQARPAIVTQGHSGEIWGLCRHPQMASILLTTADDKTLRVWNMDEKRMTGRVTLSGPSRSVAISPDGALAVCGCLTGHIDVVDLRTMTLVRTLAPSHPKEVSVLQFSPDGQRLAAGNHHMEIDLYSVPAWERLGALHGHTSYVLALDWSVDGRYIQSNSGDYEILFWDTASRAQITASSSLKDVDWATWTCKIGWPVQGIWPPCSDGSDINSVERHPDGHLLAIGNDFRMVQLGRYPCTDRKAQMVNFPGHSEHVTSVRWSCDGSRLFSTGGLDMATVTWMLVA